MRRQIVNKRSVISKKKQITEENVTEPSPLQEEGIKNNVDHNINYNQAEKEKNDEEPEIKVMKNVKGKTDLIEPELPKIIIEEKQKENTIIKTANTETEENIKKEEIEEKKESSKEIRRCNIHKYFNWFLIIAGISIGGYTIYRRFKK